MTYKTRIYQQKSTDNKACKSTSRVASDKPLRKYDIINTFLVVRRRVLLVF